MQFIPVVAGGGGVSLPEGSLVTAASSVVVAYTNTTAVALSPVVPSGSRPLWLHIYTLVAQAGTPDSHGIDIGTDADPDQFIALANAIPQAGGGTFFPHNSDTLVAGLYTALGADTTVKARYREVVGAGAPATAGQWAVVLYYALPAS